MLQIAKEISFDLFNIDSSLPPPLSLYLTFWQYTS